MLVLLPGVALLAAVRGAAAAAGWCRGGHTAAARERVGAVTPLPRASVLLLLCP